MRYSVSLKFKYFSMKMNQEKRKNKFYIGENETLNPLEFCVYHRISGLRKCTAG